MITVLQILSKTIVVSLAIVTFIVGLMVMFIVITACLTDRLFGKYQPSLAVRSRWLKTKNSNRSNVYSSDDVLEGQYTTIETPK